MGEAGKALTVILMSIDVKIKLAKNAASQFNSDNPIMMCLKESYTEVMIPCLVEIRGGIKEWIDIPEISDEQDPSAVLLILAGLIIDRGKRFEELKVRTNSPVAAARYDLCAGIHHDLSLEILNQAAWYEKNQNEKSLQTNQETQIKETAEELNKTNVQQMRPSIVETFSTPAQNNQQETASNNLEDPQKQKDTFSESEAYGCLFFLVLGFLIIFAVGGAGAVIWVVSLISVIFGIIWGVADSNNK